MYIGGNNGIRFFLVESTSLAQLYERLSRQLILITILEGEDKLIGELRNCPSVRAWEKLADGQRYKLEFTGNQKDSALLLKKFDYSRSCDRRFPL